MAPPIGPALVIVVLLLIAIGLGALLYVLHRRRMQALEAAAAELGLVFDRHDPERLDRMFESFAVINQGHSRAARNVMRGQYRGGDMRLFEFHFVTGSGKSRHHHVCSAALLHLGAASPWLRIVPETWDKKIWDALGGDDIDFESDEFSRRFWVKSEEHRFAYDVIHPRMMEFLMTPGWTKWELRGGYVCLWNGGRYQPEEVRGVLDRLHAFAGHVPRRLGIVLEAGRGLPP